MRSLVRRSVWVSVFTCRKCGRKMEIWHHGCDNKREARNDMQSDAKTGYNGWDMRRPGRELCVLCRQGFDIPLKKDVGFVMRRKKGK